MLTHLQIRDFAIIDAVELELRPGLTVLTGETGAGKSIVVDALQLLAGGRAGAKWCATAPSAPRSAARSTWHARPRELKPWLEEQSIERRAPSWWCAAWSAPTAARAPTSTASRCRCSCCARPATSSSTSTASTNSSR